MSNVISPMQAKELIEGLKGKFFTVTFVKKTTGELRTINATMNMDSKLVGGESTLQRFQFPFICASTQKFKSCYLDTILEVKANKTVYTIDHQAA